MVDHKRPTKRAEVSPTTRTPGEWRLESDFSVVIGTQVCIPIQQCGPDDAPLGERKANALRLANAAALEDHLRELMDADAELERASFNQVGGKDLLRKAQERWVLARAAAHELLTRLKGGAA